MIWQGNIKLLANPMSCVRNMFEIPESAIVSIFSKKVSSVIGLSTITFCAIANRKASANFKNIKHANENDNLQNMNKREINFRI